MTNDSELQHLGNSVKLQGAVSLFGTERAMSGVGSLPGKTQALGVPCLLKSPRDLFLLFMYCPGEGNNLDGKLRCQGWESQS